MLIQLKSPILRSFLASFLAIFQFAVILHAQATSEPEAPYRVLVKFRTSMALEIEAALPTPTLELNSGHSGKPRLDAFLSRHSARKLRPLYPELVRAKKNRSMSDFELASEIRRRFPSRSVRSRGNFDPPELSRTYAIEVNASSPVELKKIIAELAADPDVEYAEPDKVDSVVDFTPNDPYFLTSGTWGQPYDDLWGIKIIGAPAAWNTNAGDGVLVAVVDTGVDLTHPDMVNNLWTNPGETSGNGIDDDHNGYIDDVNGWDFIGPHYYSPTQDNNVIDGMGHGTHVSGTIAATGNNGIGVIGVAWRAKVMPVKGLDNQGYGLDSTLANALHYAADNGAEIISNSWAGQGSSQTIADAVSYAYSLGAVVVAAAGNSDDDARNYYPANLWNVITVGASTPPSYGYESRAYFSNWGSKIDVLAPGQDILSLRAAGTTMGTPVDSYYTRADGTSMATPHVSGAAALVLSQHPGYSNEDVRQVLRTSATDLYSSGFDLDEGYGRINTAAALGVTSVLEAKISSPNDGTHVKTATTISGVAQGNNFSYYTLEYGAGHLPTSWTLLQTGNAPTSGALGVFDPGSLSDGVYCIRLTSVDTSGHSFVDRIELNVDYVTITSPPPPAVPVLASEYKPGAQVSITGTASGGSFQDFHVEWAEGINPSSGWSSAGFTLIGGGTAPVTNDVLATWDTSSVTQPDYFTVRLTVDNAGYSSQAYTLVYLEPALLGFNWPKWMPQGPSFGCGLLPALDAANNPRLTLMNPVYGDTNLPAQYWSIAPDGSTLFTQNLYYGDYMQPAVGEMDGQPGDESVVPEANQIRIFHSDNSSTIFTNTLSTYVNFQYALPILEDLNGDSQLETVAVGSSFSTNTAYVFAWRRDGQQLNANFPITIADQNINVRYAQGARLLVGDINNDGLREIVVQEGTSSSSFTLRLFNHDGTPQNWAVPVLSGYPTQMLLADLDHNGHLETILLVISNSQTVLHVFQPDGTERSGWPVVLSGSGQIAVGDLNRDGREEIVAVTYSKIYALNADGTAFSSVFPINTQNYTPYWGVAIADVDGDGYPEILTIQDHSYSSTNPLLPQQFGGRSINSQTTTTAEGEVASVQQMEVPSAAAYPAEAYAEPTLEAIRRDGTIWKSWRLLGANGNQPDYNGTITVADFNRDGLTDIGVTYRTITGGGVSGYLDQGVATVVTTGAPFIQANNDWPLIYQNSRNTAVLIRDHTPPTVSVTSPAAGSSVVGQVTLTANASDNVLVTSVQFQVDGVNVGPGLTIAPFSYAWDSGQASSGTHTITAVASDAAGNSATSAPITLTVQQYARLTFSPAAVTFAGQQIGTTSSSQSVTLTNSDAVPVSITAVSVIGDYGETDNCNTTLAPGASCLINVIFTPSKRGPDNGSLTVTGNFAGIAPTLNLSGTGQLLQATASPASLTFPGQPVNTQSTQIVTYTNTGDLPVTISGISVSGDYKQTNACGASLGPNAECTISVAFVPTAAGQRTGVLSINGNVTTTVNLTGTGQVGQITLSPSSIAFGNQSLNTTSSPQIVTVTSVGANPATISGWGYTGGYSATNNCPYVLQPGSSCTFSVTFTPQVAGSQNGTLNIYGAIQNSPVGVPLSGTGVGAAGYLTPIGVDFGKQQVNSPGGSQTFYLYNTGNADMTIAGFQITGDYAITSNACGSVLSGGSNCGVVVAFQPTTTGTRSGTLTVSTNAYPTIPASNLTGVGIVAAASFSLNSISFSPQPIGSSSAAQQVTLTNASSTTFSIFGFNMSGDFSQTNNCGTALVPGASCSVSVTFTPTARGARTGAMILNSSLSGNPSTVTLSGTGQATLANASPSSLSFGIQDLNTTSAAQTVIFSNTGDLPVSITSVSTNTDFSQTNNCVSPLATGANCSISITFRPSATGSRSGTLTISGNFQGSPATASLTGTGVTPGASISPASLSYGSQRVGTVSNAQNVTLTNTGAGPLLISGFTMSGDFSQTNNCGASLAASASCTVSVAFAPTARGTRSGRLTLNSNAPGTPPSVSLSGTGIAPVASLSPTSLSFGTQRVGTASGQKSVNLSNSGDAILEISSISVSANFAETNNCAATLAIGAHCTINVTFKPTATGTLTGTLTVNDDASNSSTQTTTLTGTGK